jgi:hypothetical protein
MTKLKFMGSICDLRQLLRTNNLIGRWEDQPNGVFMWRGSGGGNLHWASMNKSVWFSGQPFFRDLLTTQIQKIISADALQRRVMDDNDNVDDDIDLDID